MVNILARSSREIDWFVLTPGHIEATRDTQAILVIRATLVTQVLQDMPNYRLALQICNYRRAEVNPADEASVKFSSEEGKLWTVPSDAASR